MYVCIYACMFCMLACTYPCMDICLSVHKCVSLRMYMCVCIYIYTGILLRFILADVCTTNGNSDFDDFC